MEANPPNNVILLNMIFALVLLGSMVYSLYEAVAHSNLLPAKIVVTVIAGIILLIILATLAEAIYLKFFKKGTK